jgi:predicted MFS family arabinose efflux permease
MNETPAEAPPGLFLAALAGLCIALLGFNTLPLLLGAAIDALALSPAQGGLLGTFEIGAMATVTLSISPFMKRVPLRRVALSCGSLVALAQVGSMWAPSFEALAALRLLSGAAAGAVYASVNSAVAGSSNPDRLYARIVFASALIAAALFVVMPIAAERWSLAGAFGTLAVTAVLCVPFTRNLPLRASDTGSTPGADAQDEPSLILRPSSLLVLAAAFILAMGEGGLWAFMERIGLGVGLSSEEIGLVLGATTVGGTSGAALAAVIGTRFGRTLPILASLLLIGVSGFVISRAEAPTTYIAAQLAYNTLYLFSTPYLLGTAAALDRAGRVAAALAGAVMIGGAVGPGVGGVLAGEANYALLGTCILAATVLACAMIAPLTLEIDKHAQIEELPPRRAQPAP